MSRWLVSFFMIWKKPQIIEEINLQNKVCHSERLEIFCMHTQFYLIQPASVESTSQVILTNSRYIKFLFGRAQTGSSINDLMIYKGTLGVY